MSALSDIIHEAESGSPEKALHDLEKYLEPVTGRIPATRQELALATKEAVAVFYLLRYIELARYSEGGHKRLDLLHRAAGLMPQSVDTVA